MNQKVIKVILMKREDECDVLRFCISDEEIYDINLNSDSCQTDIMTIFNKMLSLSVEEDIVLDYHPEEGYSTGLYKDVCFVYIQDIQKELQKSTDIIRSQLS